MQQGHWDWLYVHTQAVEHHDASRQALFQMLDISSKSEREMIAARVNAGMAWSMAELARPGKFTAAPASCAGAWADPVQNLKRSSVPAVFEFCLCCAPSATAPGPTRC